MYAGCDFYYAIVVRNRLDLFTIQVFSLYLKIGRCRTIGNCYQFNFCIVQEYFDSNPLEKVSPFTFLKHKVIAYSFLVATQIFCGSH